MPTNLFLGRIWPRTRMRFSSHITEINRISIISERKLTLYDLLKLLLKPLEWLFVLWKGYQRPNIINNIMERVASSWEKFNQIANFL